MGYEVFDLTDSDCWHRYLNKIPISSKDIYFTPEYCEIYERNGDGEAHLFIYEDGELFVYYPFLIRKIEHGLNVYMLEKKYGELYDMTTPYGYGGPITNVTDHSEQQQFFSDFHAALKDYCQKENIITEFVRFHPLIRNQFIYPIEKEYMHDTVYVDLDISLDGIWANYDTKNRNRIRKARTHQLQVSHQRVTELHQLISLYEKTMDKCHAKKYYYFDKQFFYHTAYLLEDHLELIEISLGDKVIISCLFMSYGEFAHYHLLGSDQAYLKYAPNNYLIHHAVEWAKLAGKKYLHLGGGLTRNDELYRFKKRFNKNGDIPFYVGKAVHNDEIYDQLSKELPDVAKDYFPLYRHPSLQVEKIMSNE